MKIKIARRAGFCMGVRRAVNLVLKALNSGQTPLYTYGPLIHNPQTLELLSNLGVRPLKSVSEAVPEGYCVIRAHGVPPTEKSDLERKHKVIDGTCPRVLKVQALASQAVASGKDVVIIGDKDHAEVRGILGYCGNRGYVVSSFQDIETLPPLTNYLILSQTTQDEEVFEVLSQEILLRFPGGEVINTICNATEVRQEEVKRLCKECSAIVVIGGKFSANTNRLAQIAEAEGKKVFLVERAEELPVDELKKFSVVGITAGASTPNWLINEVVDYLKGAGNPLYLLFRSFILLNLHEVLSFFLLLLGLLLIQPASIPKIEFLLLFTLCFQFFRKNLTDFLQKETFSSYYPLKESFITQNQGKIFFLLGITLIGALLSAFLYHPRLISLIIIFTLLNLLLLKSSFLAFLDLLFYISLLSYLYPYWNELFLWVSLHVLPSLFFIQLYKELLYLQSDGFLPRNFIILSFLRKGETFWYKVLKLLLLFLFLPFFIILYKFKLYAFLFYFLLLPLYMAMIYLLKKRPLGQIIYLESLGLLPPLVFVLLSFLISKLIW
ncbi:hydroxymethylbutenyl pyrophosphate reductase [Caldimicrobium thiodismutans]|uniref:4-hydroxy-3-methylbut-2-enyl diphosphate reductase n=1 Tax=Caldimicrobium thiodismutans TaxID=1653476 RepID=A0A0U5ATP4_9BACT|nr:4-hydroxy-3-methylbut-2-enyl diphosphate reductase [Caldimicrobium thiodismutans]BAU22632.1 hydroxymethylbutenyl pyrophosphate reductase [Caldimicrobium thiodismutans]